MRNDGSGSLEQVELDPERFPRAWAAMRTAVAEGVTPGIVAGLWEARAPDRIRVAALGKRRVFPPELPQLPMLPETVFDLASLTKIMATAQLTATLVDRGWISWRTPLQAILPRAAWPGVELGHLLSHTAGFAAWIPLYERLCERFAPTPVYLVPVRERQRAAREIVCAVVPEARPGERMVYSDIGPWLLGFALEEVTGLPFDCAVRRMVWGPLGLDTAFFRHVVDEPVRGRREDVAATEESPWRGGLLQGQVHDDNCWAMGGYSGNAGVFGTVRDVLQFARAIYPGVGNAISRETLRAMWARVNEPAGCSRTLGWDTPSGAESSVGHHFSPRTVGHLGYTGTSLWIDQDAGLAVTLLTNRVHPTRENNQIRAFRPRFHDAIREDLGSC